MRIAIVGAHRTGKTTLVEALAERLGSEAFAEPYYLLEEEGHDFADPPTPEDYEQQLRRSLALIDEAPADAILDRSPLDFVAYLRAMGARFEIDDWLDELRDAMQAIDLVVVTRIESPDVIAVGAHEDRGLRARVDELIESLVLDDARGILGEVLEVRGTVEQRVAQVLGASRG